MPRDLLQALPETVQKACAVLARHVQRAGGRTVLVGGAVRDALLGQQPEEADVEVFGLSVADLRTTLQKSFRIDEVGKAFGVFKIKGAPIDVSLPRRESKQGTGHKGFRIEGDPTMSFQEAAARRDFTINAMGWDVFGRELLDPWGGEADLRERTLRHVSDPFAEDPLRVLRGMQFVARFGLTPAPETIALCQTIPFEDLPRERVFEEWKKLLLKGQKISEGLAFLHATGWVAHFPELAALIGCAQDPEWHPEGDVWTHTAYCLDAFARARLGDPWEDLVVGLAVLCHDLGKPATTTHDDDGHIRALNHDVEGEAPTRAFLARLTAQVDLVEAVVPLVVHHMRPSQFFASGAGDAAIRRLSRKVGRIDRLVRVTQADAGGRPPLPGDAPEAPWLLRRAEELAVADAAPKPIIQGRHLIALGHEPGEWFGEVLEELYEAQLEGDVTDETSGLARLRTILDRRSRT